MPVPSGIFSRSMNPWARVSSVSAISASTRTVEPSAFCIERVCTGSFFAEEQLAVTQSSRVITESSSIFFDDFTFTLHYSVSRNIWRTSSTEEASVVYSSAIRSACCASIYLMVSGFSSVMMTVSSFQVHFDGFNS